MAPLMIAGPKPAPRKKQPIGARERFDITDLILLYREVTPEPRVVFKVQKTREFRAIRDTAPRIGAQRDSEAGKGRHVASDWPRSGRNGGAPITNVRATEIPHRFPHDSLISLDFSLTGVAVGRRGETRGSK